MCEKQWVEEFTPSFMSFFAFPITFLLIYKIFDNFDNVPKFPACIQYECVYVCVRAHACLCTSVINVLLCGWECCVIQTQWTSSSRSFLTGPGRPVDVAHCQHATGVINVPYRHCHCNSPTTGPEMGDWARVIAPLLQGKNTHQAANHPARKLLWDLSPQTASRLLKLPPSFAVLLRCSIALFHPVFNT